MMGQSIHYNDNCRHLSRHLKTLVSRHLANPDLATMSTLSDEDYD